MDLDDFMNPWEDLTFSQVCERIESDNKNLCINTQDIKTIDFDDLDFLSQDIKTDLDFFSCEIDDATLSSFNIAKYNQWLSGSFKILFLGEGFASILRTKFSYDVENNIHFFRAGCAYCRYYNYLDKL